MNCCCYRAVKLLEYGRKLVEGVLERLCKTLTVNEMHIIIIIIMVIFKCYFSRELIALS